MTELSKRKEKIKTFFKDYSNLILVGILLFTFIVRMYFLFSTLNQPLWWDEAQYAEQARRSGLSLDTNDIWYYRRTMLLPLFWSLFFNAGFGEIALRFTEVLFSVLLVFATYLVGKELFNKEVGLIAAFGVSFSRIILFETARLLNSVPAAALIMLGVYYFYKGYFKNESMKYLYLFGLFAGLAMNIRFATFLSLISFGLIFLIKEKGKFWKNKHMLGAFLLILILLMPFFYLYQQHYPGGVKDFLKQYGEVGVPKEEKQPYLGYNGLIEYLKIIPDNTSWLLFLLFIFGGIILLDFLIAPDLLLKENNLQRNLFLFLFILPPFIYHSLKSLYVEERYLIGILPIILIISSYGLYKVYDYLKNYNKYAVTGVMIILLVISSVYQVKAANDVINSRKDSYSQIKEASAWLKENTKEGDVIISNSIPQMQYYTDRSVYYIEDENEILNLKPKYYVVSIYEKSADSYYKYPEENPNKWNGVKVYFLDEGKTRPSLAIYEYIGK